MLDPVLSQRAMDILEVKAELIIQMNLATDPEEKELFKFDIEYCEALLLLDDFNLSS